jgi:hypothetical protein
MTVRRSLLVLALSCPFASAAAMAQVEIRMSAGGPAVILPAAHPRAMVASLPDDIDPWVRDHVMNRDMAPPPKALFETMAAEMIDRYAPIVGSIDDRDALKRLQDIAAGATIEDYARPKGFETAVRFSESVFDVPEDSSRESPDAAAGDQGEELMTFLGTQEGMRLLSTMSGDQIGAMASLVAAMQRDSAAGAAMPVGAPLSGVPELSASALESVDINDLLSKPGRTEASVRDVGNGENLLLEGWVAEFDPERGVMISNPAITASEMIVEEGMVIGPFGAVASIEDRDGILVVRLESGDEIRSLDKVDLAPLVPDLDQVARSSTQGEFILTALPDIPRVAKERLSSLAPMTSLRPTSRPRPEATAEPAEVVLASTRPRARPGSISDQSAETGRNTAAATPSPRDP